MKLLLIDSQIMDVRRMKPMLSWEDYGFRHVFTAYTWEHAIELTAEHSPDLVICDTDVSEMKGITLAGELKKRFPQTEVIMTGQTLREDEFRRLLRLEVLDFLKKPVKPEALKEAVCLFGERRRRHQEEAASQQNSQYWEKNHVLIQELFWKNLCLNRVSADPEAIERTAKQMDVPLDKDSPCEMILITMKNQDEMWGIWGENMCQAAIQNLARAIMKRPEEAEKVVIIYSRVVILMDPEESDAVEERCAALIKRCREELGAELVCYIGDPSYCENLASVYNYLLSYSKNDVLRQKSIVHVKNVPLKDGGEIIAPKNWEDFLYRADPEGLAGEVRSFLIPLARQGRLTEQNVRIFQQDMLQLFFSYMEKEGRSAHELYDNNTIYRLYKTAILSIDGMCQWVKSCGEYLTGGIREQGRRERLTAAIKDYIRAYMKEEITVAQVAQAIHLSPDYTTRLFKKETGMTIKEYLIRKRMERAGELLRGTEESVTAVAMEVGYDNLSYFVKKFRSVYGITPKQYQKRKENKF